MREGEREKMCWRKMRRKKKTKRRRRRSQFSACWSSVCCTLLTICRAFFFVFSDFYLALCGYCGRAFLAIHSDYLLIYFNLCDMGIGQRRQNSKRCVLQSAHSTQWMNDEDVFMHLIRPTTVRWHFSDNIRRACRSQVFGCWFSVCRVNFFFVLFVDA